MANIHDHVIIDGNAYWVEDGDVHGAPVAISGKVVWEDSGPVEVGEHADQVAVADAIARLSAAVKHMVRDA